MRRVFVERIAYHGWPNCYRLTNGEVELIATSDVGPRVMRYGFVNGPNLFYEVQAQLGNSAEPWWMMRGGHRLWIAPEKIPETYALDNGRVEASVLADDTVSLLAGVEDETKLRKQMILTLCENGRVRVEHKVENTGRAMVRLAIWPATLMAPGGTAFAAFPQNPPRLGPTHPVVMWSYTDFSDARWRFTRRYLVLHQDANADTQQKAGLFNEHTLGGYLVGETLFVKQAQALPDVPYPDFHCSLQMFTNRDFMELETLGPLTNLAPGETASHTEMWSLHSSIRIPDWTDETLDALCADILK